MSLKDRLNLVRARRGCPICGQDATVTIQIRLNKIPAAGEKGEAVTRAVSMCENHGIEHFQTFVDQVDTLRDPLSSSAPTSPSGRPALSPAQGSPRGAAAERATTRTEVNT